MISTITVVTQTGHHHSFDTRADGKCIWSCFAGKDLPIQYGEVMKFASPPKIGESFTFTCKYLQDSDILDGVYRVMKEDNFFITTTSKVVDIIR